ncbi:Lrp/AsnC family transcriptional regulator, leucine-responsive regulatory protein [Noviherbaspirillum humi]|uniref:Lrp/AsnC family transcriptional regulator, leucine-responsive regulatory protein n=1 Tax=Noviherbaspirillum humi TaxID=1688639 RepID=A0A239C888_9BURK|nr:Lrp/AsnC family transcriptional regulator [Noviherbaspirillum humi]SNS16447.1 Lrp/AsnC family transcriptional regulator, leucine-responsive regulatory protein [Noviherbaspirillum humi]
MQSLDRYDRAILRTLQENGRASNVELSDKASLSAPQCYRRVQRMESEGVIRGYTVKIDPEAIGLGVTAFVSLNLDREQFKQVRSMEKVIRQFPEILECYAISGDFDYLLKVVASDLKSLSAFLTDRLMQVPGVSGVRSTVCLEEIKPVSPLPLDRGR